jgi:hypothetical protein
LLFKSKCGRSSVLSSIPFSLSISCDADEDLDAFLYEFMHKDDGCEDDPDTGYDECLYDVYRDCYDSSRGTYYCDNDDFYCDDEGNCVGMSTSSYAVPFSRYQDTFAVPINLKENVNVDEFKAFEPVTVCTNSWANYCAENKAQFKDEVEKACFWGGIAGSVAVSGLSGGVTGTVIVPVAVGSASVACEKIANMESKWPHDQH